MIPYIAVFGAVTYFFAWEYPGYNCSLLIPVGSFPLAIYLVKKYPRDATLCFFMYFYLAFHVTHCITILAVDHA